MKRIQKIQYLIDKGENIEYHFKQYTHQRRLIIDKVENFSYNNTASDQLLAGQHIDLLFGEGKRY